MGKVSVISGLLLVCLLALAQGCATAPDAGPAATVAAPSPAAATLEVTDPSEVIAPFAGSEARHDDRIGFEEYMLVVGEDEVSAVDGTIRRIFFRVPEGRSPLEVVRYYQQAVQERGGTILFQTRAPGSIEIADRNLVSYFNTQRVDRGMSTYVWDFYRFPRSVSEYLAAEVPVGDTTVYVALAAGRGAGGAEYHGVRYELVTVVQ